METEETESGTWKNGNGNVGNGRRNNAVHLVQVIYTRTVHLLNFSTTQSVVYLALVYVILAIFMLYTPTVVCVCPVQWFPDNELQADTVHDRL